MKKIAIFLTVLLSISSAYGMKRQHEEEISQNQESKVPTIAQLSPIEEQEIITELKQILESCIFLPFSINDHEQLLKNINLPLNQNLGVLLHLSIEKASLKTINFLVEKLKADVNFPTKSGITPLHISAIYKPEVIAILLQHGANIEAQDNRGLTPLLYAAAKNLKSTEILLKHGANIEAKEQNGATPLHISAIYKPEVIAILLQHGANIEAQDNRGLTPLLCAAAKNLKSTEILLKHGAKIEAKVQNGATPLDVAAKYNSEAVEILLKRGAKIDAKGPNGVTPLHVAAEYNSEAIEILLKNGANIEAKTALGYTPLHLAARDNPSSLGILLKNGANFEAKNNRGESPLHLAAMCQPDAIEQLMQLANAESITNLHFTPLHSAITNKNQKSIEILLSLGVQINAPDHMGLTPLHLAVSNFPESIALLLRYGANINAKNKKGETPLHLAMIYKESQCFIPLLLEHNAKVNAKTATKKTPLHLAARFNPEAIEILLKYKANIEAKDYKGFTPLHIAAKYNLSSLGILLKNGANIEAKNNRGESPLHLAASENMLKSIEILLENNADINSQDNDGDVPLFSCLTNNTVNYKALRILLNHYVKTQQTKNLKLADLNNHVEFLGNMSRKNQNSTEFWKTMTAAYNTIEAGINLFDAMSFVNYYQINQFLPIYKKLNYIDKLFDLTKYATNVIPQKYIDLIKDGINLNTLDLNNKRLIDYAAQNGNTQLMALLFYLGANIDYITVQKILGQTTSSDFIHKLVPELTSKKE